MKGVGASTRVFELIEERKVVPSKATYFVTAADFEGPIRFDNVSFTYPDRMTAMPVLSSLSFELPRGNTKKRKRNQNRGSHFLF